MYESHLKCQVAEKTAHCLLRSVPVLEEMETGVNTQVLKVLYDMCCEDRLSHAGLACEPVAQEKLLVQVSPLLERV
jgi:hypothetical protein